MSIIIPAYEEGRIIGGLLDRITESVEISSEVIIVVDDDSDSTATAVQDWKKQSQPRSTVQCVVNQRESGPAQAIRWGIELARAPVIVVTMADGSDDPRQIEDLVRLVERGVVIAAASRYMPGGQQVGGPAVKRRLSRLAGKSLKLLARVGTSDATNSFKAYNRSFLVENGIASKAGFELGIEMTAKARRLRMPVAEIPTVWIDRSEGESHFQLFKWMPNYIKWYLHAFGRRVPQDEKKLGDNRRA